MKAYDFSYDGKNLSDFGMMICRFGSDGLETVADGAEITFNTISTHNGAKSELTSVVYENCLEATFQICKHSCSGGMQEITAAEHRNLTKWLNRKRFLKLKIFDKDYMDLYYEARINVSKINLDGKLVGFELNILTNRPFALRDPVTININNTKANGQHSINDISHEEGYIYPYTKITVKEAGNLKIVNAMENRSTYIANCAAGEKITMDYPIIQSSDPSHKIENDFNWNFFRVANTYDNSRNDLTISIPCSIELKYSPIVKVGL